MTRLQNNWQLATILLVVFAIVSAGCQPIQPGARQAGRQADRQGGMGGRFADVTNVDDQGATAVDHTMMQTALAAMPVTDLTATEQAGLLYMREEEKLAHDVYITLGEKWNMPAFQNISQSEQTHMDAIKLLLDRYGLADPATDQAVGIFTDATLQGLYNELVAKGSQNLAAALTVGATIEDLDIVDLQTRLAQTDKADIQLVYENLLKGSRNHLRAFTRTLTRQAGATYTPQYLSQKAFTEIVNAPMERGISR